MTTLHGKITSSQISYVGTHGMPYGYLGLRLEDGTHVDVKVDVYTLYDTLAVGDHVFVEVKPLGNRGILVATRIAYASSDGAPAVIEGEETMSSA